MEKEKVFELIEEHILPVFKEYMRTRSVKHITSEQSKILKKVWSFIMPTSYYNASCPGCVQTVLEHTESWYGREKKRWLLAHPVPVVIPVEENKVEQKKEIEEVILKNQDENTIAGNEEVPSPVPEPEKKKRGRKKKGSK